MIPDISMGLYVLQMVTHTKGNHLQKGCCPVSTDTADGRADQSHPNSVLADFRTHFHEDGCQNTRLNIFKNATLKALPYLVCFFRS